MSDRIRHLAGGAGAIVLVAVMAIAPAGCGGDSDDGTTETRPAVEPAPAVPEADRPPKVTTCRVEGVRKGRLISSNVGCTAARAVATQWLDDGSCAPPAGESRSSCTIDGFRCLAVATGQGTSVSCSRSQRAIGFLAAPR